MKTKKISPSLSQVSHKILTSPKGQGIAQDCQKRPDQTNIQRQDDFLQTAVLPLILVTQHRFKYIQPRHSNHTLSQSNWVQDWVQYIYSLFMQTIEWKIGFTIFIHCSCRQWVKDWVHYIYSLFMQTVEWKIGFIIFIHCSCRQLSERLGSLYLFTVHADSWVKDWVQYIYSLFMQTVEWKIGFTIFIHCSCRQWAKDWVHYIYSLFMQTVVCCT